MEVVKTTHAGHAKSLISTSDFSTCPNGVVCVGGDGIVNEVLNGLLLRSDRTEAVSNPVGIIPAGSDNSLVCTVLGAGVWILLNCSRSGSPAQQKSDS
ncbi:hypothetical protein PVAP13_1NG244200 [Panicum virgatum]|uniref:DAGKc domain-containing protein n=1 Tax=Panicum virgatum TaxID=38727 RepID=A0A8T0X3S0_PANVG|nr:hypothetical protein PVAP13_1NG244200 [Panicum virgatum]